MAAKFGTSGLRGLATELLDGAARHHVAAFLLHLLNEGAIQPGDRVFMAQDHRHSSPAIAAECAGAIAAAGLVPVDCGTVPTPALALHAMAAGSASVMITGSHIPADRNGCKFYRPDGEITKADELAIIAWLGAAEALDARVASAATKARRWPATRSAMRPSPVTKC
jgi:phosphomannomutase